MTTVYLLKQMIRLWPARSSWNTLERFLLKTHWGSAHTAGSPPCSQSLGQSQAPKERCHSGEGAGAAPVLTLCHKSIPSPIPAVAVAHCHPPSGGVTQECPRAANWQQNIPGALCVNSSDCSPDKVFSLWCNYGIKYKKLFLGMNFAKIWLVDQTLWAIKQERKCG